MQLLQIGTNKVLDVDDKGLVLGRSRDLGISCKRVSRQHCTVSLANSDACILVKASKRLWVKKGSQIEVVEPGESCMVSCVCTVIGTALGDVKAARRKSLFVGIDCRKSFRQPGDLVS